MAETEIRLAYWRSGPTQAEQLCAGVLRLEGFLNIEPQSPLGGADDGKDLLCDRGGLKWVGAVYFPPTEKTPAEVRAKFLHDLEGVARHARHGIVFMSNQRPTLDARNALVKEAADRGLECLIYDVERIRGVLDSPDGYGLRIAYLGIEMSRDEQLAYFARRDSVLQNLVERNTQELRRLSAQLTSMQAVQQTTAITMNSMAQLAGLDASSFLPRTVDPLALGDLEPEAGTSPFTKELSPEFILFVHRLVGFELPPRMAGRYRTTEITLQRPSGDDVESFAPPPFTQIAKLVDELCERWRTSFTTLKTDEQKFEQIARFHRDLLFIHPFMDGNGRMSRAIILQQCLDLFGRANMSRFDRGAPYVGALAAADKGDYSGLVGLLRPVVED